MCSRATGMNHSFGNTFMIEVRNFFSQYEILQEAWAALARLQAVLVIANSNSLVGRKKLPG